MYALKIEVDADAALHKRLAAGTEGPSRKHEHGQDEDVDSVPVSVGNPRVEHINGIVHLYRESSDNADPGSSAPSLPVRTKLHLLPYTTTIYTSHSYVLKVRQTRGAA